MPTTRVVAGQPCLKKITCFSMSSAQNIYDDPSFFEGYEKLRRTATGLNEVLEQLALRSMLPKSLKSMRILDLGCGCGD
jgi:ubiquinone/menaquinone biosynthesis C-methylase UbiE